MARLIGFGGLALSIFLCVTLIFTLPAANADTIVNFNTSLGSFEVQLYDTAAPITVQNFLSYVNGGLYQNSFIHRSIPGFVIQGGGFTYDQPQLEAVNFPSIPTFPSIDNEFDPSRSNLRGTIAMAKTSDPDSATSQFFFNLGDNSTSLDNPANSGGFTVFGEVIGNGMDIVDAIAGLEIINFTYGGNGVFASLPLRNYTMTDYYASVLLTDDHVVLVDITVPEPATLSLLTVGLGILIKNRRRK